MAVDLIDMDAMDEGKTYVERFALWPKQWNAFSINLKSRDWEEYLFDASSLSNIPEKRGVYSFVIKPNIANHPSCAYLMYIGQTTDQNFRLRFNQYLREQSGKCKSRPLVQYMLRKYRDNLYFICRPLSKRLDPKRVEDELLKAFLPPVNEKFPVEVRRIVKKIYG